MARCRPNLQTSRVLFSFLKHTYYFFGMALKMERKNINRCLGGLRMEDQSERSPQIVPASATKTRRSVRFQESFESQIADLKQLPGL